MKVKGKKSKSKNAKWKLHSSEREKEYEYMNCRQILVIGMTKRKQRMFPELFKHFTLLVVTNRESRLVSQGFDCCCCCDEPAGAMKQSSSGMSYTPTIMKLRARIGVHKRA